MCPGRPGPDASGPVARRGEPAVEGGCHRVNCQLKAHVLTYHHRLPSVVRHQLPPLYRMLHRQSHSPAAAWNMESFLYHDGQLSENVFHRKNVKHLFILLAPIHDTHTDLDGVPESDSSLARAMSSTTD